MSLSVTVDIHDWKPHTNFHSPPPRPKHLPGWLMWFTVNWNPIFCLSKPSSQCKLTNSKLMQSQNKIYPKFQNSQKLIQLSTTCMHVHDDRWMQIHTHMKTCKSVFRSKWYTLYVQATVLEYLHDASGTKETGSITLKPELCVAPTQGMFTYPVSDVLEGDEGVLALWLMPRSCSIFSTEWVMFIRRWRHACG